VTEVLELEHLTSGRQRACSPSAPRPFPVEHTTSQAIDDAMLGLVSVPHEAERESFASPTVNRTCDQQPGRRKENT
jgi:hypothetical protein